MTPAVSHNLVTIPEIRPPGGGLRAKFSRVTERPVDPADQIRIGEVGDGPSTLTLNGHLLDIIAHAIEADTSRGPNRNRGPGRTRLRRTSSTPWARVDVWSPQAAEPNGNKLVGRGRPFRPDTTAARLNLSFERMSRNFRYRDEFASYLGNRYGLGHAYRRYWSDRMRRGATGVAPQSEVERFYDQMPAASASSPQFQARRTFGDYLNKSFWNDVERARYLGVDMRVIPSPAVDLQLQSGGAQVMLAGELDAPCFIYDLAALGVGAGKPKELYGLRPDPLGTYIDDLEPLNEKLRTAFMLGRQEWIGLIGARLTCADAFGTFREMEIRELLMGAGNNATAAHALLELGPAEDLIPPSKVAIMAPKAVLPAIAMPGGEDIKLTEFTEERLLSCLAARGTITMDDIKHLAVAEFRAHHLHAEDLERAFCAARSPETHLKQQLAAAEGRDESLRVGVLLINNMLLHNQLLHRFGDGSVQQFFRDYESNITALRGLMPKYVAQRMYDNIEAGYLSILPGLKGIAKYGDRYGAAFNGQVFRFPCLINATGARDPLEIEIIKRLLDAGIGREDGRGGLAVDFATQQLLAPPGSANPPIIALGDITNGTHQNQSSIFRISQAGFRGATWMAQRILPAAFTPEQVARAERFVRDIQPQAGLVPSDYENAMPWADVAAEWIEAIEAVHPIRQFEMAGR